MAPRTATVLLALLGLTSLSGCLITEDFVDGNTSLEQDATSDTQPSPEDAGDGSSSDAAPDADVEPDALACGGACRSGDLFLCGARQDSCGQTVDCACPEGFTCGSDGRLCELRPDTEITRCDNGLDDDGDNLTDCADSDCFPKRNTSHPCWTQTYHVFVTRNDTRGNIVPVVPPGTTPPTGAAAADRQCQNEAGAAQLGSDWKAIVSTKTESALDRLTLRQAPIVTTRGQQVASSEAGLWDGAIDQAIRYDQFGDDVSQLGNTGVYVWSGTNRDGTSSGSDCAGWTSEEQAGVGDYGILIANNGSWLSSASAGSCAEYRHLYCINGQSQ